MPEKTIASRIINKHDVESNWNSSSFVPQKGELVIYDIDSNHAYERFKIGDGVNTVPNLPWSPSQTQSMIALEENQDLNDCTPSYTGESVTYYTNSNTLALTLSNCPTQVSFQLTSTCLAVTGRYVQTLQDINDNLYVRSCNSNVWTNWQLQTNSTGSYPEMEVGRALQLTTARTIRTNLASTSTASFNGTANVTPGVTGTLPIANGGTGLTSNPSILVNLASTTAANVLQTSPRPGVIGTLPVARGGTGQTSLSNVTVGEATSDDRGNNIFNTYMGHWTVNELKDGTSSTDFNDYVEPGFYELIGSSSAPMSNAPISSSNTSDSNGNWYVQVLRRGSTYVTQLAYSVRADTAVAIRTLSNGVWTNWRLINEWNGNPMMAPPKARGNSSNTALTRYYKIATCQVNAKWQDCYARMEFFDYNHVNVNERGCGIDICARSTADTGVITIDGSLLYGDDNYLSKIYAVYTPTGTTYPKTVDLYFFCDNLAYQEIAVKIFYTRSRTGENTFTWDYSDGNLYIDTLPEGSTAVLLSDVITRTTLAADALTLNGVAASNYITTNTTQTISGQKTYTAAQSYDGPVILMDEEVQRLRMGGSSKHAYLDFFYDGASNLTSNIYESASGTLNVNGNLFTRNGVATLRANSTLAASPSTSDDSTKIATTAWVKDQNYLDSIPGASQTVLGGVKVYTDSSGYLCIDTE